MNIFEVLLNAADLFQFFFLISRFGLSPKRKFLLCKPIKKFDESIIRVIQNKLLFFSKWRSSKSLQMVRKTF